MTVKRLLIFVMLLLFNVFICEGTELSISLKKRVKLDDLQFLSKNRLIRVKEKEGFEIEINGESGEWVEVEIINMGINDKLKIVEVFPEKKKLILDKDGKGIVNVGVLIAFKGMTLPGKYKSDLQAKVKYLQ